MHSYKWKYIESTYMNPCPQTQTPYCRVMPLSGLAIKNHNKPYMAKKAIESGTQERKNKVFKRHIDFKRQQ